MSYHYMGIRNYVRIKKIKYKGEKCCMKKTKGIINKYFDYDIVGEYLEWQDGKFVKKYIRRYKWRKRG